MYYTISHRAPNIENDKIRKQINGLQAAIDEMEQKIAEYKTEIKRLKAQVKQVEDDPWDSVGG